MKRLQFPLIIIMFVFIFSVSYHLFFLNDLDYIFTINSPVTLSALIISALFLFLRLLDVLIWNPARNAGVMKTPRLFVDIINFVLLSFVILFLVSKVFNRPITGILAASGALGVIIGLSMQRILADLFTGIAINMDKTIRIKDWVEYSRSNGLIVGQVIEINWRTVKILTPDNSVVIIPNASLSTDSIKNLSRPSGKNMYILDFVLDFEVPSKRVLTLLEAAVLSVEEVLELPKPEVYIDSVLGNGVKYVIRFWLDINRVNVPFGKHLVYQSALNHIHQSGLSLSYSKHDIYYKKMPKRQLDRHRDILPLLKRVPLFTMLNTNELNIINEGITEHTIKADQLVVKAGNAGSSMFIVVEGLLNVFVDKVLNGQVKRLRVNKLSPGDFFGEMSLLTGEPRSATIIARTEAIVYEIKKSTIMKVLKERPEVGKQLSRILADRILLNESAKIKYKDNKVKLASTLFSRMKGFFFGI